MKNPRAVDRLRHTTGLVLVLAGLVIWWCSPSTAARGTAPSPGASPSPSGLSCGLTLIAITWVTSYLRVGPRPRSTLPLVFAADRVVEVGGTTLQAWRRVPSQLNMETPFDTEVPMTLAVDGGVLVVLLTVFAAASFRHRPTGPAGMPLAVRSGRGDDAGGRSAAVVPVPAASRVSGSLPSPVAAAGQVPPAPPATGTHLRSS